MVVGVKEKSDIKFEKTADLMINGKMFNNQSVYGDKIAPNRRDVFVDNDVRKSFPNNKLPKTAKVNWMGKDYRGKLSFRYRRGGGAIPVYQFFI